MTQVHIQAEDAADMQAAILDTINGCPHAFKTSDLICKLADAVRHYDDLLKMVEAESRYARNMIDTDQYHMLVELTAVLSAKVGMPHDEMLDEICFRFKVEDVQMLLIRDFFDAITFCWDYVKHRS